MKMLLAAILGGAVVFVWGWVSWMVLPWHAPTLKVFASEEQVTQTLTDNAPTSGVYVLPNPEHIQSNTLPEVAQQAKEAASERLRKGPFAFVAFTREGMDPRMTVQLAGALALDVAVAFLIVLLLRTTDGLGYVSRALFVTVIGFIVALAGNGPYWIWWRFATDYTLVSCADAVIGWFLAGLMIAAFTGEERSRLGASYRRVRL
ncbi:MAG: hypothetical protein ACT4NU_06850 [Chromatiales bacterium]